MAPTLPFRHRQRGVVAVMAGLTAVTLFAFGGIVLDLGHLYIAKTELQNASDAAALAGAKELNNKLTGVNAAVNRAIATAAQHDYNFNSPVAITIANIRLGTCPNASNTNTWSRPRNRAPTCAFVPAASVTDDATASGLSFIEVDTGNQTLNTYLMRVAGAAYNTTQTAGYSVAGRYQTQVTPIGVCAVDPVNRTNQYIHSNGMTELVELGFRRGVTYNLFRLNPLVSGPSDPYLINPVDAAPNGCDPFHSSQDFTAPFLCTGNSAVISSSGGKVYTNTGMTTSLALSLNSRFDMYGGASKCDPGSAPPDTNIKEYHCHPNSAADPACTNSGALTTPTDWMEPGLNTLPNREFVETGTDPLAPYFFNKPMYKRPDISPVPDLAFDKYGVTWSYGHAYHADGSSPPKAGAPFTTTEANGSDMYNTAGAPLSYFDLGQYPTIAGAGFGSPAPYNQPPGSVYHKAPTHPGERNRRMLNIVIVDCTVPAVKLSGCTEPAMEVAGIGKFFMQVPADFSGGPTRHLDVEFAGLLDDIPLSEIRLYR